jgi:hypothetical protein
MKRRNWISVAAATQIMVLAGCVPALMAPTVVVTPGPGKLPAEFAADQTGCATQANQQLAPAVQAANNQIVGNALLGAAFGAGSSAGSSNSAVAGNASAGAATTGAATALPAQATLQQQFNVAYSECMYAKGDIVPGMTPVVTDEPPPVQHVKRYAHKKPAEKPASASFVEPAPAPAAQGGGSFVEPAPAASAAPAAAGGGFAEPPPVAH